MTHPLADRIATRRKARGWSLRKLAAASGVSVAMLSEIERGTKNPTVRLAYQIAQALGCSISALVDEPRDDLPPDLDAVPGARLVTDALVRTGHALPLFGGRCELALYELAPGCVVGPLEANAEGTRESVLGLEGELELWLDGTRYPILPGTSRSHGPARTEYRNTSTTAGCRFLVVIDTSAIA